MKRLLLQGEAGAGKTTLCCKIAWDWLTGKGFKQFDLVLLVPLRNVENNATIGEIVKHYLSDNNTVTAEQLDEYCKANPERGVHPLWRDWTSLPETSLRKTLRTLLSRSWGVSLSSNVQSWCLRGHGRRIKSGGMFISKNIMALSVCRDSTRKTFPRTSRSSSAPTQLLRTAWSTSWKENDSIAENMPLSLFTPQCYVWCGGICPKKRKTAFAFCRPFPSCSSPWWHFS